MKINVILILSILLINFSPNNDAMRIKINRLSFSDLCIQGNLSINDETIGYSLELPKVGNHTSVSSIEAGTYKGAIREDGILGWRIELQNVEDRDNIQIHIGNIRDNSRGCILVGTTANATDCTIGQSKPIMNRIKDEYYSSGNSNKEIIITITE